MLCTRSIYDLVYLCNELVYDVQLYYLQQVKDKRRTRMKKTKYSISFIIPAHNAQNTLREAVESIVHEAGAEWQYEILIIENTSTDNTWKVAKDLEGEYPGIVHTDTCDPGVSFGRNKGLDLAEGEWVVFVDADDRLLPGAGAVMEHDLRSGKADLYMHSYEAGRKDVHICPAGGAAYPYTYVTAARIRMLKQPTHYLTVWSKIFRRSVIEKYGLRFNTQLRLSEDSEFMIRYTKHCRCIQMSDRKMYRYSTDSASTIRTYDGRKKKDYLKALRVTSWDMKREWPEIRKAYAYYVLMQFNLMMVREVFAMENKAGFVRKCREMRKIYDLKIFRHAFSMIDHEDWIEPAILPFVFLKAGMDPAAGLVYRARVHMNHVGRIQAGVKEGKSAEPD